MYRRNNSKSEAAIYEIYRACRLCGAGGGYKMPIVQDVVHLDTEIELKEMIKECVQIEVINVFLVILLFVDYRAF